MPIAQGPNRGFSSLSKHLFSPPGTDNTGGQGPEQSLLQNTGSPPGFHSISQLGSQPTSQIPKPQVPNHCITLLPRSTLVTV